MVIRYCKVISTLHTVLRINTLSKKSILFKLLSFHMLVYSCSNIYLQLFVYFSNFVYKNHFVYTCQLYVYKFQLLIIFGQRIDFQNSIVNACAFLNETCFLKKMWKLEPLYALLSESRHVDFVSISHTAKRLPPKSEFAWCATKKRYGLNNKALG